MKVTVYDAAGGSVITDVDFGGVDSLTSRQMVKFQRALGNEAFDDFMQASMKGIPRPDGTAAMVWVLLSDDFPNSTVDDIDFDYAEMVGDEDDPGKAEEILDVT